MAINLLNDRTITQRIAEFRADANARDTLLNDGGNLYVRLRKNAADDVSAVWTLIYRKPGATAKQKLPLGNYGDHSLRAAREWAAEQRRLLDAHANPLQVRNDIRRAAAQQSDKTLDALLDAYIEHQKASGKSSAADAENLFKNHIGDALRRRPAIEIAYQEFLAMLNGMRNKKGKPIPRTVAKVRAYLRAAYCLSTRADQQVGLPDTLKGFGITALNNPMLNVLADPGGKAGRGKRALTAEELKTYLGHVEKLANKDVKNLLLLQVYAGGQRVSQLIACSVVGDQLHLLDTKGKRTEPRNHYVPLIGPAVDLAKHHRPLRDVAKIKARQLLASGAVRRISKRMGMEPNPDSPDAPGTPFNLSDIRRSIETLLSAAGISKDHRGQLQSHGIGGVQDAHYDQHHYRPEKMAALQLLHRIIAGAGGNVVELRPAA
ncbi:MAG: integrase family protein [Azonexus sp.]